jgi:formylglycine-generating enzyme required for sulfatase activity
MRRRRWLLVAAAIAPTAVLAAEGCRAPTEVTLALRTDIDCKDFEGAEIRVGSPEKAELGDPVTEATTCNADGTIGTLVVVPSGASDAEFEVVVVAGRAVDPATGCKAPAYAAPKKPGASVEPGCVVARRRMKFLPHTPLKLPIDLRKACIGVTCDVDSTCVNGTCFQATFSDPSACEGDGCGEGSLTTPTPTRKGGGAGGAGGNGGSGGATTTSTTTTTSGSGGSGGATTTTSGGGGAGGASTTSATGGAGGAGTQTLAGDTMPSCKLNDPRCGPDSVSCCESRFVPTTSFQMGRGDNPAEDAYPNGAADEKPEHTATLSTGFYLDTFEVTVGRFREFVKVYDSQPVAAGTHAYRGNAATGFPDVYGHPQLWSSAAQLPSAMYSNCRVWTDPGGTNTSGSHKNAVDGKLGWIDANALMPMNCVTWFEAFAFCAWDGGRLPTEAEWEMAAAGSSDNGLYPWGPTAPLDAQVASGRADLFMPVGSRPQGRGKWGHYDLAGSAAEWVLDAYGAGFYASASALDADPVETTYSLYTMPDLSGRLLSVVRGGSSFEADAGAFRAARRDGRTPNMYRVESVGFRCARDK